MADKNPLTPEEVTELFSEIDASGVLDPTLAKKRTERMREKEAAAKRGDKAALAQLRSEDRASQAKHIDPLSEDDPSGSQVSHTITKTAMAVVIGILVLIVGMQIGYGVMRRLNTANLSESVSVDTVSTALKGGLEWGNGFTQFPLDFSVDEADERTGTVEVTVLDTSSANELELLSNGQIQAAALATNALLNDKIDRVVYNVHAYIDEDSNIQHDSFFGMFPRGSSERHFDVCVDQELIQRHEYRLEDAHRKHGRHHCRAHSKTGELGFVADRGPGGEPDQD